jgi:hypothetical protein
MEPQKLTVRALQLYKSIAVATSATTNAGVKSLYSPSETISTSHPPSNAVSPYPAVPHALWAPYLELRSGPVTDIHRAFEPYL